MIKIAFFDVDGTLLPKGSNRIPLSTVQAIKKMKQNGIRIFIATGRHQTQLEDLPLDEIEFDGYLTMEGAYCYEKYETLYACPLEKNDCQQIIKIVENDPFPVIFATEKKMWINMVNNHVKNVHDRLNAYIPEIKEIHAIQDEAIYFMILYCSSKQRDQIISCTSSTKITWWDSDSAADLVHVNAGKDKGVIAVLEKYGYKKEEAIAFGDSANDLALFDACGVKVAMGNAIDELKEIADFVTTNDIDDGIYHAAKKYGLLGD